MRNELMNMKNGLITPFTMNSEYLNRAVKLGIYFPEDYSPFVQHTLFICFDGRDLSQIGRIHRKYETLKDDLDNPAVFLFIHYNNVDERKDEYHPEGIHREKFQKFVAEELLDYIQDTFNFSRDKNNTIVIGDSLAASISLTLAIEYPDLTSKCCLFSPMITDKINNQINNLSQERKSELNLYLVVGKEEDHFKLLTGDYADFLNPIRQLHQVLIENNISHYYAELDGGHTWKTWHTEIDKCLNYYLI